MKISKTIRFGLMAAALAGGIALPMTGEASIWGLLGKELGASVKDGVKDGVVNGVVGGLMGVGTSDPSARLAKEALEAEKNIELSPYMKSMDPATRGYSYQNYAQTYGVSMEEAARIASEETMNMTKQLGGKTYSWEEYIQMKEEAESKGLVLADDGNTYTQKEYNKMQEQKGREMMADMQRRQKETEQARKEAGGVETVAVYQGHRYYLYSGGCATWEEARAKCEALGGHLVTIESAAENMAIHMYIMMPEEVHMVEGGVDGMVGTENMRVMHGQAPLVLSDENLRCPYIGLYLKNGEWKWVDGTPLDYTNWHKGKAGIKEGKPYARYIDFTSEKAMTQYAKNYDQSALAAWEPDSFKNGAFLCEWDGPNDNIPKLPEKDINMFVPQEMQGAEAANPMATSELMSYEEMQKRMSGMGVM